jgi:hypothetical protein
MHVRHSNSMYDSMSPDYDRMYGETGGLGNRVSSADTGTKNGRHLLN